jgi:hypothetical protein
VPGRDRGWPVRERLPGANRIARISEEPCDPRGHGSTNFGVRALIDGEFSQKHDEIAAGP